MSSEATIYFEAGVFYYHIKYPNLEEPPFPGTRVEYNCTFIPSGNTFVHHVYLEQPNDIQRLINKWNSVCPDNWQYSIKD